MLNVSVLVNGFHSIAVGVRTNLLECVPDGAGSAIVQVKSDVEDDVGLHVLPLRLSLSSF